MPCYHPIKMLKLFDNETGKYHMQFAPPGTERIDNNLIIEVPCGQCIGCRLDYSREWANRCVLESQKYKNNYMITLTYDDEHVPTNKRVNLTTGEVEKVNTLYPADLSTFMKDLRSYYKYHYEHENIRFFGAGEYGEHTERPHYHIIIFNLPIDDLKPFTKNEMGQTTYLSETIRKIWKKGNINVAEVNWNTCAYVARYVVKKVTGPNAKDYYKNKMIEPEFVRMSRMPGIGMEYYKEHKDEIYKYDNITIKNMKNEPHKYKPPKYFDRLMKEENPDYMSKLSEIRKEVAKTTFNNEFKNTSKSEFEYRNTKEIAKVNQILSLKR